MSDRMRTSCLRGLAATAVLVAGLALAVPATAKPAGTGNWDRTYAWEFCLEWDYLLADDVSPSSEPEECTTSSSSTRTGRLEAAATWRALKVQPDRIALAAAGASVHEYVRIVNPGPQLTFTATFDVEDADAAASGWGDAFAQVLLAVFRPGCTTGCEPDVATVTVATSVPGAPAPGRSGAVPVTVTVTAATGTLPTGSYRLAQILYTHAQGGRSPGAAASASATVTASGFTYTKGASS